MNNSIIKNDKKIAFAIALKYNQLKRESLENLEVKQFVNYLFKFKWKKEAPENISAAVVEIMQAKAEHIVTYLSNDAVVESKHKNLSDYKDLFRQEVAK
ncbi:MAG: hypothetical protein GX769_01710 [Erysipelothrix sp.]|nr:hypothetical protein [Erysipelothrix sp.]